MKTLKGLVEFQISLTRNRHPRWKHAIAMYISYKVGSLKIAWNFLKMVLADQAAKESTKKVIVVKESPRVELLIHGMERNIDNPYNLRKS